MTADGNTGSNFNRYWYANNNPYKFTDPDGRESASFYTNPDMQMAAPDLSPSEAGAAINFAVALYSGGFSSAARALIGGVRGLASANSPSKTEKTHTTYTRAKDDGTVYSGRTSGKGTPEQQVTARLNKPDHKAKTSEGYGPGAVDKSSTNPNAIRGREQQLIDKNGGAQSQGGTSGNKINGVSPTNTQRETYQKACTKEFGC